MKSGQSKVMRCSKYLNTSQMDVRLNGEPLMEVDSFGEPLEKSQVAAVEVVKGMWYTMIEGYRAC